MPDDGCPFCPGSGRVPDSYDVYLYPNDFPAFPGKCDVVLYSPEHHRLPSELSVEQWEQVIALWTRRTEELAADPEVKYVMVFENTGEAVGVTMPHPHGQIYAFPFIPLRIERELQSAACAHCRVLAEELQNGARIVDQNEYFCAFVPYFARFPYEMSIYSRTHVARLADLTNRRALAEMLSVVRKKYDALFRSPMPLMMIVHQERHFYIEFLPLRRSANKLKYLAAVESATWTFLEDVIPEQAAEELRRLRIS